MKNFFCLISFGFCLTTLVSCVSTDDANEMAVEPEQSGVVVDNNSTEEEVKKVEGFYMSKDEQGYLMYEGEEVMDVTEVFSSEEFFRPAWYEIANVIDAGEQKYVFFDVIFECGGCVAFSKNYLVIDKADGSTEARELTGAPDAGLFDKTVIGNFTVFSPDKTKIAYLGFELDLGEGIYSKEKVFVYDLIKDENKKYLDISDDRTLVECVQQMFCYLIGGGISWDETGQNVKVTSVEKPLGGSGTVDDFSTYIAVEEGINITYEKDDYSGADEIASYGADFEGDGVAEEVLFYKKDDNIGDGEYRMNRHLKIYKLIKGEWQIVKEDVAAMTNAAVESDISFKVVDIGNDGKDEVFVVRSSGRTHRYYIFGYDGSEYKDYAIEKGYLNAEKYTDGENEKLIYFGALVGDTGITENYNVVCGDYSMVEIKTDDAACRKFKLFFKYENDKFSSPVVIPGD